LKLRILKKLLVLTEGDKIKITIGPYYEPRNFVMYSNWKVFGFIVNKKLVFDRDWLVERTKLLVENRRIEIDVNIDELKEGKRLLRSGITSPELLLLCSTTHFS